MRYVSFNLPSVLLWKTVLINSTQNMKSYELIMPLEDVMLLVLHN